MIKDPKERLGQAAALAERLVDQVRYVDLIDEELSERQKEPVREDGVFCVHATAYVTDHRRREALKRIVEKNAERIGGNELALRFLNPEEVGAAAELVTQAIKGILIAGGSGSNDWVRNRRLVIRFESIASPWIEDPVNTGMFSGLLQSGLAATN